MTIFIHALIVGVAREISVRLIAPVIIADQCESRSFALCSVICLADAGFLLALLFTTSTLFPWLLVRGTRAKIDSNAAGGSVVFFIAE